MSAIHLFLPEFDRLLPGRGWRMAHLPCLRTLPRPETAVDALGLRSLRDPVGLPLVLFIHSDWYGDYVGATGGVVPVEGETCPAEFASWARVGPAELLDRLDEFRVSQAEQHRRRCRIGGNPEQVLQNLQGRVTDRKLRLVACGVCRLLPEYTADPASREAVLAAERYADGLCTRRDLRRVRKHSALGRWLTNYDAFPEALAVIRRTRECLGQEQDAAINRVLGEIVGEPAAGPGAQASGVWLRSGREALAIAEVIDREGRYGDLPVLADALEDAGCTWEPALLHLRSPGPHLRGCWALDALRQYQAPAAKGVGL